MSRESTAFHEAGHAAIGLLHGFPLERVSIVQDEDSAGHVINSWGDYCTDESIEACSACSRPTCGPIQTTPEGAHFVLAGVCAEALYEGSGNDEALLAQALENLIHGSGSADSENTDGLLFDGEELGCALRNALELLRANWPLVDALAAALLAQETLDSAQLLKVRDSLDSSHC